MYDYLVLAHRLHPSSPLQFSAGVPFLSTSAMRCVLPGRRISQYKHSLFPTLPVFFTSVKDLLPFLLTTTTFHRVSLFLIHRISGTSEGQGFSVGRIRVPIPLPSKTPTLGRGYGFSGGKRRGFCKMVGRRRTSLWQMQLSSPWLFPQRKHTI